MKFSMKIITIIALISFKLALSQSQNNQSETFKTSKFYTDSIYSNHLSEYRKHNIYLPKGFNSANKYSIIYATDGNIKEGNRDIKKLLDSLIDLNSIRPIIYVESHCNKKIADSTSEKLGDGTKSYIQYRNFEYLETKYSEGYSSPKLKNRFKNHMLYFENEFIPEVEKELNLNVKKNDRIFYGYSNGAAFGINLLNKNPELLNHYICYSTIGSNAHNLKWDKNIKYPNLYIQYGSEESFLFKMEAEKIVKNYNSTKSFYELKEFKGGHNSKSWMKQFEKSLISLLSI